MNIGLAELVILAKESDGEVIEVNKQTKLDELFNKLHFILRDAANRAKTHVIKLIDCNKIKVKSLVES